MKTKRRTTRPRTVRGTANTVATQFAKRGFKSEFVGTSGYPITAYVKKILPAGRAEMWVMRYAEEPSDLPTTMSQKVFATVIIDGEQVQNFSWPSVTAFLRSIR